MEVSAKFIGTCTPLLSDDYVIDLERKMHMIQEYSSKSQILTEIEQTQPNHTNNTSYIPINDDLLLMISYVQPVYHLVINQ